MRARPTTMDWMPFHNLCGHYTEVDCEAVNCSAVIVDSLGHCKDGAITPRAPPARLALDAAVAMTFSRREVSAHGENNPLCGPLLARGTELRNRTRK
jgi:hypothetical protein